MSVEGWRNRGNFSCRLGQKRSVTERLPCCYHYTQQSSQMSDDMNRRIRLGAEQKRLSDAERLCGSNFEHCPEFLKQPPLLGEVTVTIEIPNSDYPSIIGLSNSCHDEDSIPIIMAETGVRIQFPDICPGGVNSNYVNQVKLIGALEKVEEARKRVRMLCPVSVAFPVDFFHPHMSQEKVKRILEDKLFEQRLQHPYLKITIMDRPAFIGQFFREIYQNADVTVCVVEGPISHEKDIYNVCEAINDLFPKNDEAEASRYLYVSWMNIPLSQQQAVTGFPDGFLIRLVSLKSNAAIFFPTPSERHVGATMFYFTGTVKAAVLARKYIQALLPMTLSFEVERSELADSSKIPCYFRDDESDVKVQIKCSSVWERIFNDDPIRDCVILESVELNLANIYKMRKKLLKASDDDSSSIGFDDYGFVDEDFRMLVKENNKFIATSEAWISVRNGVTRVPPFDPKVPAPFCPSEIQRPLNGWPESYRPLQTCFVGAIRPTTTFSGPVFVPNTGSHWTPSLQHSSSLPTFGYQQYHSPSTTIMSEDHSFADSKIDHSQCSSNDVPTTAVQQLLDSFKSTKPTSFKRHNLVSRSAQLDELQALQQKISRIKIYSKMH